MKQYTLRIPDDLDEEVVAISENEDRAMNKVFCLLLRQAVKERNRKKKNAKKDHPTDNPPN
jgi:hypothetical protein